MRGIASHFSKRILLLLVSTILIGALAFAKVYQERARDMLSGQGEIFARTTLAATAEALYTQDYAFLIEHLQQVLEGTPSIRSVQFHSGEGDVLTIDKQHWSLDQADPLDNTLAPASLDIEYRDGETQFVFEQPVEIATYPWGRIFIGIEGAAYGQMMNNFWQGYLWFSVALLLGSVVFLWLSARPVISQLAALRDAARRIGSGEFHRVEETGIGEIAELASDLNAMSRSLEDKTHRIGQLARVVRETNEGFMLFDKGGRCVFANASMSRLMRLSDGALMRRSIDQILNHFEMAMRDVNQLKQAMQRGEAIAWTADVMLRADDNKSNPVFLALKLETLSHADDAMSGYVLGLMDITSRKALENRLNTLAHYDNLTKLPNRRQFMTTIDRMIRREKSFAVLFMDLDNFKDINDTLGHDVGDDLLRAVSKRITGCLREDDMLARLGGDEFTAIIAGETSEERLATLAQRVIEAIQEPLTVDDQPLTVGISIGIVLYPQNGTSVSELIRNADIAMYEVKRRGRNDFCFFSETMQLRVIEHLTTEQALREAIRNDELKLVYQPIVNAGTHRLEGCEALCRWPAEQTPPNVFVSIAERSTLINELDRWVIVNALRQLREWNALGFYPKMSINVSGRNLSRSDFADQFIDLVHEHEIDLSHIRLEITENVFIDSDDPAFRTLLKLRDHGCSLAVDDFGTGYSSLSYLSRLPIDTVKLDKS
ncbi:MAG: diguanylate cyclase, partial [Pseudomonadota bacterium]